jgi:hypothetical protein
MKNTLETILMYVAAILFIALLMGLPLMALWNALMPRIFGLTEITFWQAIGLNLLSSILFKSNNSTKGTS